MRFTDIASKVQSTSESNFDDLTELLQIAQQYVTSDEDAVRLYQAGLLSARSVRVKLDDGKVTAEFDLTPVHRFIASKTGRFEPAS